VEYLVAFGLLLVGLCAIASVSQESAGPPAVEADGPSHAVPDEVLTQAVREHAKPGKAQAEPVPEPAPEPTPDEPSAPSPAEPAPEPAPEEAPPAEPAPEPAPTEPAPPEPAPDAPPV
jgi:hypothetical protein